MTKTILVVEDDHDIRENMAEFLLSEGYEVRTAANGKEALDLLNTTLAPSMILLDLMMPVMDGFRFRQEQEKDPKIAHIPVVLMTATPQVENTKTRLGAIAFIRKPIDIEELSSLLQVFFDGSLVR
ncbi:MAG: response regulator [Bdellovibrionota bacterium]